MKRLLTFVFTLLCAAQLHAAGVISSNLPTATPVATDYVLGVEDTTGSNKLYRINTFVSTNMNPTALTISGSAVTPVGTLPTGAAGRLRYRVTLTENITVNNPSGTVVDGTEMLIEFIQDGTGSRTVTMGSEFAFGSDITGITLTPTANKTDFATFIYHASADKWRCVGVVRGY